MDPVDEAYRIYEELPTKIQDAINGVQELVEPAEPPAPEADLSAVDIQAAADQAANAAAVADDVGGLLREVSTKLNKLDGLLDAFAQEKIVLPVEVLEEVMGRRGRRMGMA